jgi:hypothetical protein
MQWPVEFLFGVECGTRLVTLFPLFFFTSLSNGDDVMKHNKAKAL